MTRQAPADESREKNTAQGTKDRLSLWIDDTPNFWRKSFSATLQAIYVTLPPQDRKITAKGKLGFRLPVLGASGPRVSGLA